MARLVNRLTTLAVNSLSVKGMHPDGAGLYLKITSTGTKSWIFRYTRDGRTRDMGLGAYPIVSLSKARSAASAARLQLTDGTTPLEARRRAQREALPVSRETNFKAAAEALIASHEAGWRNPKHRTQWRSTLKTYVYPLIGHKHVAEVDTADVLKVLQPIWTKLPETSGRVRGRIEAVLSWATARGFRTAPNPAAWRGHLDKLLPPKSKIRPVRHHPALPYQELPAFIDELRRHGGIAAPALEFCILTASRTSEVLLAEWKEVDTDERLWIVPASRMKAGKEHRVPLSGRAIKLLDRMTRVREGDYIFPGGKPGRPLSNMALAMLLRDIREGVTVHGFRSTFKDWAAETTAYPNFVSEAALAHVVADKVEAAYRRGDLLDQRRRLMEEWAVFAA